MPVSEIPLAEMQSYNQPYTTSGLLFPPRAHHSNTWCWLRPAYLGGVWILPPPPLKKKVQLNFYKIILPSIPYHLRPGSEQMYHHW